MSRIYENLDEVLSDAELKSNQDPLDARTDPTGQHPKVDYFNASGVNKYARGTERKNIYTGGSVADIDLELIEEPVSTYTNTQVKETPSGHIIEYDDTPGAEKIMLRHRTGSGVEMKADGTVVYSSTANTVRVTAHDEKVIVDGDGELQYNGNLKLKVTGDFDLEVGGDFNVNVDGDIDEKVKRGITRRIAGNIESEVIGSVSETVVGSSSKLVFGDKTEITKRNYSNFIGGDENHNIGGSLTLTTENNIIVSTLNANISASSLLVQGDSGTIGGHEIVYYGKTAHIPRVNSTSIHASQGVIASVGMTAPTFNGNLSGNASTAGTAGTAAAGPSGGSSQATVSITEATNKTTVQPNTTNITTFLNKSPIAIQQVDIDDGDLMKNSVDKTVKYGGVAKVDLTTREVRSKLRDPNNLNNETFIGSCITDGVLSPNFASLVPKVTDRSNGSEKIPSTGSKPIGKSRNQNKKYTTQSSKFVRADFFVDPKYNPVFQDIITMRTKLAPGIPMAKFLCGIGDSVTLTHILDDNEKLRLAKQYVLHAQAMKLINKSSGNSRFSEFRLQVVEGLYRSEPGETLDVSDGINYLMSRGQTVVYEIIGKDGEISQDRTFELAVFWKNNLQFEKLILDYDTYNPDNTLNAQIILTMPEITSPWSVVYNNNVETRFNNSVQTTNELIEILA
ncbi:MAG: hypothetical protein CL851_06020 [Crocinitomicaceae bacterium]|nr:hypothetical protein [Crocinitomicaceae bacterium]|tara:strand:- start:7150 stop:9183 length:2034 start_codon:yes stop_codon:yes gene_type:complete